MTRTVSKARSAGAIICGLVLLAVSASCASDDDKSTSKTTDASNDTTAEPEDTSDAGGSATIGYSFADLQNPAYVQVKTEAEAAFGAAGIELISTDSQQDPSKQLDDMEGFIAQGVDLIVVDPVDEVAIVPALEAANDAGIPILMLVKKPEGGEWASRIYLDQINHAYTACDYLASQLGEGATVAQLQGIMSIGGYRDRSDGCQKALDEHGIEIVASQEGGGERTQSLDVMEAILQVHPDVQGVFGANDEEALGAVEALKAAGIDPGERVIVGIDGTQVALESMCAGELTATVADLFADYARMIVEISSAILAGDTVEPEYELKGTLTTKDNLAEIIELTGYDITTCPLID